MSDIHDLSRPLADAVRAAHAARTPLRIVGGGTKASRSRPVTGAALDLRPHRGIVHYEPTELVLTARAGTPLAEIESALDAHGQMLAFEPPHFSAAATLGGTIACGLSGPRRPYAGAARDFVLGMRIINGRGEVLRFGGEVMKNVAGYDVSRLMTGAFGTLGVLLEVSLKVLPKPRAEITLAREATAADAIRLANAWAGTPLPLSAVCHDGARLIARLSGAEEALAVARTRIGGETIGHAADFWRGLREQSLPFFRDVTSLWRLSVAPARAPIGLPGEWLLDWGGAQRWLKSDASPEAIRAAAEQAGGHATCHNRHHGTTFHPLQPAQLALHRRIKDAFDPARILNPGALYPDI